VPRCCFGHALFPGNQKRAGIIAEKEPELGQNQLFGTKLKVTQIVRHHQKLIRYAAYGSNLHPLRLALRTPSSRFLGKSCVPGWSLQFHKRSIDGSAKCNIVNSGRGVYVAVFEMHEKDKQKLDEIEGTGKGYHNSSIDVPDFGTCFTYLGATSHICDELKPYDWYKEIVLLGCRKLDFPDRFTSTIEAVKNGPDPNDERSREQWQIVELLRRDV
jgi:hypothetical protein